MELEEAARTRILGVSGVSAMVGTRVYFDDRPQSASLPAVEITIENLDVPSALDGGDGTGSGTLKVRFVSRVLSECESMAVSLRDAIDGVSAVWSGLEIDAVMSQGDADDYSPADDGSDRGTWEIESTYQILFKLGA